MLPYVPDVPLGQQTDIAYKADASMDAYAPASAAGQLATVVWIHGGAWISGDKRDVAPYLKILAAKGYTTIGPSYPIAPESIYPAAVEDINDALAYIKDHAAELNVDPK